MSFYETIWESDEDEQSGIDEYELNGDLIRHLTLANNLEGRLEDELQTANQPNDAPGVNHDSLESILSGPSESSTSSTSPVASSPDPTPVSNSHAEHRVIPQYEPGDLARYTRKRPCPKASSKSGAATPTVITRLTLGALRAHPLYTTAAMLPLTRCVHPNAQRLATLLRYCAIPRMDVLAAHVDDAHVDLTLLPVRSFTEDAGGGSHTSLVSGVPNAADARHVLLLDGPVDARQWARQWGADRDHAHNSCSGSGDRSGPESAAPSAAGYADAHLSLIEARPTLPLPTLLPTALCAHLAIELAYHVVARTDVCVLRSDAQWLKHGRRVRPAEEHTPYRVVERTARRLLPPPRDHRDRHDQLGRHLGLNGLNGDRTHAEPLGPGRVRVSLYGEWQTDAMNVPISDVPGEHTAASATATATSPPVPVNRFGNVDLSNHGQLPPGTEHVPAVEAAEACAVLGIPHAPAVTGWRSCPAAGASVEPVVGGVVVWAVDAPAVRAALEEITVRKRARRRVDEWRGAVRDWAVLARAVAGRRKAFVDAARSRR